jgi:hypothetical protein
MTGRKQRLKMLRLRRVWPTLACTIPQGKANGFLLVGLLDTLHFSETTE